MAVQNIHDDALSEEYAKQEKLLLKVIELQRENQKLSSKLLGIHLQRQGSMNIPEEAD